MGEFKGQMQVPGVVEWPLSVKIELDEERISIAAAGYEVGNWSLKEVKIKNCNRGFEVQARGEHFFVSTDDDSEFALEVGMRRVIPNIGNRNRDVVAIAEALVEQREQIDTDEIAEVFRNRMRPREAAGASLKLNVGRGRHERRAGRHIRSMFRSS